MHEIFYAQCLLSAVQATSTYIPIFIITHNVFISFFGFSLFSIAFNGYLHFQYFVWTFLTRNKFFYLEYIFTLFHIQSHMYLYNLSVQTTNFSQNQKNEIAFQQRFFFAKNIMFEPVVTTLIPSKIQPKIQNSY